MYFHVSLLGMLLNISLYNEYIDKTEHLNKIQ